MSTLKAQLAVSAIVLMMGACVTPPDRAETTRPDARTFDPVERLSSEASLAGPADTAPARQIERFEGTGRFVRAPASDSNRRPTFSPNDPVEINLADVSVQEAASAILGDLLGVPFIVESDVAGSVTLQTNGPIDAGVLLGVLEDILSQQDLALIETDGAYRIANASSALGYVRTGRQSAGSRSLRPGFQVLIQPLAFVSASEMAEILEPISDGSGVLRVDPARNLLVLSGSQRDIRAMLETIEIFDVDWLSGMSFSIVPITSASPTQIVTDVENVLGTEGSPFTELVRLVPNDRLKSIIVISPQAQYLTEAETWIKRLDQQASATDQELFIYNVQYSTAEELAAVAQSVLTGRGQSAGTNVLAPGLQPVTVERTEPGAETVQQPVTRFSSGPQTGGGIQDLSDVRIYPYDGKNALVIVGTRDQYNRILTMLETLDVVANQVLLEATIVEVALKDELSRGIQWFFSEGNADVTFSNATNGSVGSVFPGFSYVFDDGDARAALNALSSITDVKVLSSPSIMVLDNRTATLQVGDQVPVTTQTASSLDNLNTAIVNSVSFRDTGVILTITPRVNDNGVVLLDIEQEVSDVVQTVTSGIDSPTIQQRRISTTVAVHDGDSLALGGLIEDSTTITDTAVPYISQVPLLGELFKSTSEVEDRTELMILIRPQVIRNREDARAATNEYRARLRGLERFDEQLAGSETEPLSEE